MIGGRLQAGVGGVDDQRPVQAEGLLPAEIPLATLAQIPMAISAGLNPENMKKISDELAAR